MYLEFHGEAVRRRLQQLLEPLPHHNRRLTQSQSLHTYILPRASNDKQASAHTLGAVSPNLEQMITITPLYFSLTICHRQPADMYETASQKVSCHEITTVPRTR